MLKIEIIRASWSLINHMSIQNRSDVSKNQKIFTYLAHSTLPDNSNHTHNITYQCVETHQKYPWQCVSIGSNSSSIRNATRIVNQSFASIMDTPQSLMLIINLYSNRVHHTRQIKCLENDFAPSSISVCVSQCIVRNSFHNLTHAQTYSRSPTA